MCDFYLNKTEKICPEKALYRIQIIGEFEPENIHVCEQHRREIPNYILVKKSKEVKPDV